MATANRSMSMSRLVTQLVVLKIATPLQQKCEEEEEKQRGSFCQKKEEKLIFCVKTDVGENVFISYCVCVCVCVCFLSASSVSKVSRTVKSQTMTSWSSSLSHLFRLLELDNLAQHKPKDVLRVAMLGVVGKEVGHTEDLPALADVVLQVVVVALPYRTG